MKIWSDLCAIFWEEFTVLDMTIREMFPILWKIFTPALMHTISICLSSNYPLIDNIYGFGPMDAYLFSKLYSKKG